MQVFKSKVDWWFYPLLGLIPLVLIPAYFEPLPRQEFLILIGASIFAIGLPLWLLVGTRYVVTGNELAIYSGPFRWRVDIHDIDVVTPTRSPLSSPALSLDRLRIEYAGRSVMVSPIDREGFLKAIGQAPD